MFSGGKWVWLPSRLILPDPGEESGIEWVQAWLGHESTAASFRGDSAGGAELQGENKTRERKAHACPCQALSCATPKPAQCSHCHDGVGIGQSLFHSSDTKEAQGRGGPQPGTIHFIPAGVKLGFCIGRNPDFTPTGRGSWVGGLTTAGLCPSSESWR